MLFSFRKAIFILIGLGLQLSVAAQTTFHDAYNNFKQQVHSEYEEFRRKANQEYAEWMRQAWEWHQLVEPVLTPKEEPVPPVVYDAKQNKSEPKPLPYDDVVPAPVPSPQPKPIAPIREDDGDYQKIQFLFYGTEGEVRLPKDQVLKLKGNDEKAYADAWEVLSSNLYDNLIRDCLVIRMKHQLCDWAYLLMLEEMSQAVCGKGTNEAVLLLSFVMCQSGYKIRLGITETNDLRLLFKSDHLIFDLTGFEMKDGLYYVLQPISSKGLRVCDISFPEEKPLSLWIPKEQLFEESLASKRVLMPADSLVKITVQVNKNLIGFYQDYPTSAVSNNMMTRWAMYGNTPMSSKIKDILYPQLREILKGVDVLTAANWLLYFVQTAFVYEYDDKVWGRDRAFFAEESLFYPYCDCEDRSILYTRLVRDLLGLKTILVYYPGHLASAVLFNNPVKGDYININGNRFTICDPTYIGAPVGVTMPNMDNKTAKVILLN